MMRRSIAVYFPALLLAGAAALPVPSAAQGWNDDRTRALVEQATERRARQIADTLLVSYQAAAHGYLTFLAQVGEGFTEPPRIVKADELSLQVYWQAPNLSKQLIAGRRDTLLLPTDISYHRDHLGIIQNNFPNIIRLGDGDEVRDVPHPLSADGLAAYDFAIRDSLRIRLGPRSLDVYEVRVRPKNDSEPRAVGAVFMDRESGEVVRMAFSFTRAALRDRDLEDVSVVLENGLIEGRFWLPHRQEIEIRRTGTWLDYPARGIIRGRWEVCCYEVNKALPDGLFRGPEIAMAPRGTPQPHPFTGRILDSLPQDVRGVTDADVARVQEEARELVRAQALARARGTSLAARSVSDFLRVNRVEGFAPGVGLTRRLGEGFAVTGRARYGFADEEVKGSGEISFRRASGAGVLFHAYDDTRDAGDVVETSRIVSSLAAQEFGEDFTDPYGVRGFAALVRSRPLNGWTVSLEGAQETQRALEVHANPSRGEYQATIAATPGRERRISLSFDRPTRIGPLGFETRIGLRATATSFQSGDSISAHASRLSATAGFERPIGGARLVLRTFAAAVAGEDIIPQRLVYLGGPTTAPGYDFHSIAAERALGQHVEVQFPVPFASFPLGRYGRTPRSITLAPYLSAAWAGETRNARALEGDPVVARKSEAYPSLGIGVITLFDLLRFDLARGVKGGGWRFSVDVAREFWSIL